MSTYIYLHRSPAIRLWGLTYSQRIQRQFSGHDDVVVVTDPNEVPGAAKLVIIDGSWLLDGRILQSLVVGAQGRYRAASADKVLALVTRGEDITTAIRDLEDDSQGLPELPEHTLEELVSTVESRLRKIDPPVIMKLNANHRRQIESALYGSAYKSVTDLVTKWAWPRPARAVTRWCAYLGLRPNHVTGLGVLLMLAAGWLFYRGDYGWGLLAGWLMTFLDTVDGKLARVTLTASKLGNALDHGVDLVHPPFWYMLWGMGLAHVSGWPFSPDLSTVYILIFAGYTAGRLAEGCFEWLIASFSLFTWRPFDSYNRLVTARRNPCLILLTAAWVMGRPDLGLYAVLVWTLLSTLVLWLRNLAAIVARRRGPLESWLSQAGRGEHFSPLALRTFAPHLLGSRPATREAR